MPSRRTIAAVTVFLAVGGAVGGTIGYGAYYRSDYYRRSVETGLAVFFGLPVEVGSIKPHGFSSRQFTNVQMWLPDHRAHIFHAPRVVWAAGGTADGVGTLVDIHDANLVIGSETWETEDYMRILRASLQHNFQALDIREVRFHNSRFRWPRHDFQLTAEGVAGRALFNDDGTGRAELTCPGLNGVTVADPVRIAALLDPLSEDFLPEVTLNVPTLPLAGLGLDRLLQSLVTQGSFAGRITLRQMPAGDEIELAGFARDVQLAEFTRRLPTGPIPAGVDLEIEQAVIRDRQVQRLIFRGDVHDLDADTLLSRLDLPRIGGRIRLTVYGGQVTPAGVDRLSAAGEWTGGSLDTLTLAILGKTSLKGQFRVRVNALVIRDRELASGDVDLIAEPPAGSPGTIERTLLLDLIREYLGVSLPESLLPATLQYTQIGAKFIIDGRHVRILALQGPAGRALITARLLDRDVPLLGDIDLSLPLDPLLARARSRVGQYKGVWKDRLVRPPGTQPGNP